MEQEKITLRDYLIEKGIDVEQCAKETGLSKSTIYQVWSGKKTPGYKCKKLLERYTEGRVSWDN